MEKEEKINKLFEKIENVDNEKESLIDELEKNQKEIINLVNKRNTKMLICFFVDLLISLGIMVFTSFAFALGTFIIGAALGVGIKELIKLKEKPFREKMSDLKENIELVKEEKVQLKNELAKYTKENEEDLMVAIDKRLNEIRQEKNELKNLRNLMDEEASYIDITDVYLVEVEGAKYIAKLDNPHKMLYRFVDVFAYIDVWSGLGHNFSEAFERYVKVQEKSLTYKKIKECEPALLAYPDNLVPDYVLRQVYYKLNNVDLNNPVLKKIN